MAEINKKFWNIFGFGAIAGLLTPLILQYIVMPVLNILGGVVPAISAKLAEPGTLAINVRESLTGVNTGLGDWLSAWMADAFGISVTMPGMTYVMAALGGGLLFVGGAYVVERFNMLKGTPQQKTRNVVFAGNIIAGLILGGLVVPQLNIGFFNVMIAFLINATVIGYGWVAIDKKAKLGLIPF